MGKEKKTRSSPPSDNDVRQLTRAHTFFGQDADRDHEKYSCAVATAGAIDVTTADDGFGIIVVSPCVTCRRASYAPRCASFDLRLTLHKF
jgi:hypothetical protein